MDMVRPTKLVVDTNAIKHNIKQIENIVGKQVTVMPVVKAIGYGTGIDTVFSIFDDLKIDILAVAVTDEGIRLRKQGFTGEIFILNQPYEDEIVKMLEYDLTPGICLAEFVKKLNKLAKESNKIAKVHLEIDTGMGRTGINPGEIDEYIQLFKQLENIKLDGIYTHFSSSDTDADYTKEQIEKFNNILKIVKQNFRDIKYIHACNTGGIINFPEAHYNMVRPGISVYGHLPNEKLKGRINLIPATVLKTKITYIHEKNSGDSISYNRTYIVGASSARKSKKPMKVGTVPIGYGDGIMRCYKGKVVVNGRLANILGVVNMDSLMIDITDFEYVKTGTDVYIWDNENITVEDIAKECGTINYEILSRLAPRVVREFI